MTRILKNAIPSAIPIALAIAALGSALRSSAVSFVTDRSLLTPNDELKWENVGAEFDAPANPLTTSTSGGLGVQVRLSDPLASYFELRDEGSGWSGNFAPGARILSTDGNAGPLVIEFASPVFGAGFQIQSDVYGAFSGTLDALGGGGSVLGSFPFNGTSTTAADNSAIFVGVLSSLADIDRLVINLTTGGPIDSFGINHISISGSNVSVPDGGSTGPLLALSAGALLVLGRWSSRKS